MLNVILLLQDVERVVEGFGGGEMEVVVLIETRENITLQQKRDSMAV